jgi:HAD superfamily hydrolase (TIGR01509 family)
MTCGTAELKAIIFDLDGVLWRSGEIHAAAYRKTLTQAGLEMPDYGSIAGRRTDEVIRELWLAQRSQVGNDSEAITQLTQEKQYLARRMLRSNPPLAPGCVDVIRALARVKQLALVSSASAETVELFLSCSGTGDYFDAIIYGDQVTIAKPHPAIYQLALQKIGRSGGETAVVEDAPSGVRAARDAGIATVIAIEGTVPRERLIEAGAHCVITNLHELVT